MSRTKTIAVVLTPLFCLLLAGSGLAAKKDKAPDAAKSANAKKTDKNANLHVDINNASEADLDKLPGVGPATAKKIVAARPYSSVQDLRKAGVSAKTIEQITPMVTVGPARSAQPAAAPPAANSRAKPSPTVAAGRASGPTPSAAAPQPPPQPGMVWVNLDTKVYHRAGDRWYGKTKKGKYMSEADAVKAGYRLAKE